MGLSTLQKSNITTGVNFASAACGVQSHIGQKNEHCLALDKQIDFFQEFIEENLTKVIGVEQVPLHLSNSLVFISIGGNDFLNDLPNMVGPNRTLSAEDFGNHLVDELSNRLKRLYNLGGRKFLVNNVGPIGCLPTITYKFGGQCVEEINALVVPYAKQLSVMLQQLQAQLPGSAFTGADSYKLFLNVIANPESYGIPNAKTPCCPDGGNGSQICLPKAVPCTFRNYYLFFDQAHTTEVANGVFARNCFSQ
ncbi:GDSL esterase/lipase family [Quillaja saponaria]|uniref:GDSL esterase/lipase family n=1 Tax=Quillaja saponaria TaxID=32244 RepID=A0AAD7L997_QUISA|nr:GDSL esterase/lipase family [Quillaja saponaria]